MAALATMAAVSSASASATNTVLCAEELQPCPASKVQPPGSGFGIQTQEFNLTTSGGQYVQLGCNQYSSALFASTREVGAPLPAISEVILNGAGCERINGGQSCSAGKKASANSPSAAIESTGKSTATITLGSATDPLVVETNCETKYFGSFPCTYTATEGVLLNVHTNREVTSSGTPMKLTKGTISGNCVEGLELRYKGRIEPPWTGWISNL